MTRMTHWLQRGEGVAAAVLSMALFVVALDATWWWMLAFFLLVDVSAIGYLANPRVGAMLYNAAHTYIAPLALGAVSVVTDARTASLVALVWGFHIGVDRALGYGLKEPDSFRHTHMGWLRGSAEQ